MLKAKVWSRSRSKFCVAASSGSWRSSGGSRLHDGSSCIIRSTKPAKVTGAGGSGSMRGMRSPPAVTSRSGFCIWVGFACSVTQMPVMQHNSSERGRSGISQMLCDSCGHSRRPLPSYITSGAGAALPNSSCNRLRRRIASTCSERNCRLYEVGLPLCANMSSDCVWLAVRLRPCTVRRLLRLRSAGPCTCCLCRLRFTVVSCSSLSSNTRSDRLRVPPAAV
mmetsp:Transcript_25338/g.63787  ORF Transcript_25338/g.63787 Transcript_25338/m.63787 type:complete len:222 (-) Transcript_25338:1162-1827(-)